MTNTISKIIHNGDEFEFDTSSVSGITTTQPSNPSEGAIYYDTTNDVVKVYDGTNWNVVGDDAADINTKTFYLSSTSDLTNAQAAYDWYLAGKNPIIRISGWNDSFILEGDNLEPTEHLGFYGVYGGADNGLSDSYIGINPRLELRYSSDTVTSVVVTPYSANTLFTNVDYSTPYTPQYNGSPATKKYVDDTVASAKSSGATAPSNPTEGQLWYDTTNDVLKVYDGTNWVEVGKEYNAGEGIGIGTYNDYSAMRGPCPEGFHVPLDTEWQAVYNIWTALGGGSSDGTNFGIVLKLPYAGCRSSYASLNGQGTNGRYLSSSRPYENNAYIMYFNSEGINPHNTNSITRSSSVRGFKDSPIIPTSSWTKLYGTSIEAGGIFWSSADGLISLSSDGQTWVTITDKNLGATTVWNSGDTLSEANCGGYFQQGNNYMFPFTGDVTTSSTQVDASNYGPGNYYSSSTYITTNPRDSSENYNLRGGETGIVTLNNAISNTGVLSVNGQTGNIIVSEPTVISGDSGTTYTIKVSNSAPASGTSNTTLTFVED